MFMKIQEACYLSDKPCTGKLGIHTGGLGLILGTKLKLVGLLNLFIYNT